MFDTLSDKLQHALGDLRGRGTLDDEAVSRAMREVRLALLEADVNFDVVKQFVAAVRERAVGEDVRKSLTPGQQVVKIVHEELTELLGGAEPTDEQDAELFLQLWPSHFADPASAPPPWDIRVCLAANEAAMASAFEHLEAGFAEALRSIAMPVVSVLGAQSPLPVRQGERTAALIPRAEVRIIPAAGTPGWCRTSASWTIAPTCSPGRPTNSPRT